MTFVKIDDQEDLVIEGEFCEKENIEGITYAATNFGKLYLGLFGYPSDKQYLETLRVYRLFENPLDKTKVSASRIKDKSKLESLSKRMQQIPYFKQMYDPCNIKDMTPEQEASLMTWEEDRLKNFS